MHKKHYIDSYKCHLLTIRQMLRRRYCVQKQWPNQIANWSCRRPGPEEAILLCVIAREWLIENLMQKNSKVILDWNFRESFKTLKPSEELQSNIQDWSRRSDISKSKLFSKPFHSAPSRSLPSSSTSPPTVPRSSSSPSSRSRRSSRKS